MIAAPVSVFVIDAMRYGVEASGARRLATSANPTPADQTSSSPWTTPTTAPGRRLSFTNEAAFASSLSATAVTGLVIASLQNQDCSPPSDDDQRVGRW
jgi:hypothetical protein